MHLWDTASPIGLNYPPHPSSNIVLQFPHSDPALMESLSPTRPPHTHTYTHTEWGYPCRLHLSAFVPLLCILVHCLQHIYWGIFLNPTLLFDLASAALGGKYLPSHWLIWEGRLVKQSLAAVRPPTPHPTTHIHTGAHSVLLVRKEKKKRSILFALKASHREIHL